MGRALGKVVVEDIFGNFVPNIPVDLLDPVSLTRIPDTIFADALSATTLSLPLTTDAYGRRWFYLATGKDVLAAYTLNGVTYTDLIPVADSTAAAAPGGVPTGPASGDLTGNYPGPTLAAGAATGAKLGADVATLTGTQTLTNKALGAGTTLPTGSATGAVLGTDVATLTGAQVLTNKTLGTGTVLPVAALQEKIALADLTDVSGTFAAGAGLRRNATGFKPNGLRFSMVAYGVVPSISSDTTTAAANSTARDACTSAALASGDGSTVELDWVGTACFSNAGTVYTRLNYVGTMWNISKLQDGATAGTHVWQTLNFGTLTQTVPASFNVGAWEFSFRDHVVDGNKANNASGGHALAIYGYGYFLDNLILQNAKSAGWWTEWNLTNEPLGNGGSQHQRAFYVGTLRCLTNDCANVAAVNTRATEARAAITGGQACVFGPGDSYINYIECYKDGSVAGIGFNQGQMDLNAGLFASFSPIITKMVVWLNHTTGVYLGGGGAQIGLLHAEGSTTCVNIASQGVHIGDGQVFFCQPSGTDFLISSGCNGGNINVVLANTPQTGITKLNIAVGACTETDLNFYLDVGSALPVTLTAGALPVNAKRICISANNYGSATVTPGWLPLKPSSTTLYGLDWHSSPVLATNGLGYTTGAGGTVTQATSKATGVTLNALSGAITMNAASLAAATTATFTVTDNRVAATDVVLVSIKSGATAGSYQATVDAVAAGSFNVSLRNISAGALAEAVVLNFAVLKAVTS